MTSPSGHVLFIPPGCYQVGGEYLEKHRNARMRGQALGLGGVFQALGMSDAPHLRGGKT